MSGHWRFCVSAFLLVAGLSTSPAFSNPLTDLFNPAPKEAEAPAAAPAPAPTREAKDECLMQPGRSVSPGRHWVYHLNGHRKCWYQADEATVAAKKQVRHSAAKQPVIASEENEAALRKKTVADARAQLLSTASADTVQPTPPAPEVADTASVPANAATALVPAAPSVAEPTLDQPTPDHAARGPVDVEMLLAAASPVGDTAASAAPPAAPVAPSTSDANENRWESMAPRAGLALIALGLIFVMASLLASRFRDPGVAPIRRA
jgi:hypothetical protein